MTTSVAEIDRWIAAPRENEHLEFKEAKNQYDTTKLFKYCVAIANEGGGKLVLGVTDKRPRQVVGSQAFPNPAKIQGLILDTIGFRIDVEEVVHPSGRVVVFHIPPRPSGTAYHFEGAYLMRSGEDLFPMSEDRLRQIFDEGKADWFVRPARGGCSPDDVIQLLDTQNYFDLQRVPYPTSREGVLDRFSQEGFVVRQSGEFAITNLGAILFAKRLDEFDGLGRKAPRVIVYEGTGKLATRLDQPGTKGYAVAFEGLVEFITAQTPQNEVVGTALREKVKMFPSLAIRELVANALIHQDFSQRGTSVVIEIYSDRVEVTNPGKPFIPPDRFIDSYQSRNERLADVMRRLRICEEKGSGIDKVIDASEVYQLPAPDFRVGELQTVAVLFSHIDFEAMDRADRIRACYQHCCLRYVMNERMTNQSLRERFKLSEAKAGTVSNVIRDTLDEGQVKLDDPGSGSKRYAKYVPFWA